MTSRELHGDVLHALEVAARRRHRATVVRKEAQKQSLSAQGYHRLQKQLNKKTFLSPIDADTTKANIYYIKRKFMRFCFEKRHGNWRYAIKWQYCNKGLIMTFLLWICETYIQPKRKRSKRKTVNQYWRDLKMLYRRSNEGRVVNANDCEEIRKYINGDLTVAFKLDDQPGPKPVMGVDDLLLGLTHHWCRDKSVFPTEGDRLDLSTIMLFQSYTACRPAELVDGAKSRGGKDPMLDDSDDEDSSTGMSVRRTRKARSSVKVKQRQPRQMVEPEESEESSSKSGNLAFSDSGASDCNVTSEIEDSNVDYDVGLDPNVSRIDVEMGGTCAAIVHNTMESEDDGEAMRKHKALCYEDIVLWIVQDPNQGGRDVLAMEVFFRHHKGADRKPKPTIFLFRENPLPILCPITHILARVIRDDAIEVDGFRHAAPFFSSHISRKAIKVHWKPSVLKMPLFRRSVRTSTGWTKSETDPMKYSTYAFYLDRIGCDLGSEERWTTYCFRRGHANALLGIAPDSIVDQVMRHDPLTGCMQNAYQNHRIGFNTQDAFLERDPSADGLTRAFTHMSIRCNPEVPKEIPKAELDKLPPDPEIVNLAKQIREMALRMRQEHGFIKSAPTTVREGYQQLRRDLKNTEKAFRTDMTKVYQEACRRRIHNEELQKQLSGTTAEPEPDGKPKPEPSVQHQLQERTQLQAILSDFRQNLGTKPITDRKIRAVDLMVLLASRREVRPLAQTPSPSPPLYRSRTHGCSSLIKPVTPKAKVEEIPLILGNKQCIYCVGEKQLPYDLRMRSFKRVSHMMDHVENVHLRHERNERSLNAFTNHVQQVHGVKLRKLQASHEPLG